MFFIQFVLIIFTISWLITAIVRKYALIHLLDKPNQRSSHHIPTPRGGGLAVVLSFSAAMAFLLVFVNGINQVLLVSVFSGLCIALIGFWDDHKPLSARWRFLVHIGGAALTVSVMSGLVWFEYFIAGFFLVWMLNLFNFMDGIDGLAGSETVFMSFALAGFLAVSQNNLALVALALAASSLGFLLWNWSPAKIFMGDVGSGFIGFMLGVFILVFGHQQPSLFYVGLILFAVFMTDATYTLLVRLFSGQQWHQAHCCHAYQQAAKQYGHLAVVQTVWVINLLWLLPLAIIAFLFTETALFILFLAYLPLVYLGVYFKAGQQLS